VSQILPDKDDQHVRQKGFSFMDDDCPADAVRGVYSPPGTTEYPKKSGNFGALSIDTQAPLSYTSLTQREIWGFQYRYSQSRKSQCK
jgi:hypothetical protein